MTIRAKQGGEVAPNGAFYKGGQFINTTASNPKQSSISRPSKPSKVEVEPYNYQVVDSGMRSKCIYSRIVDSCRIVETSFKAKDWKVDRSSINHGHLDYIGMSIEEFNRLADLFDSGARFD